MRPVQQLFVRAVIEEEEGPEQYFPRPEKPHSVDLSHFAQDQQEELSPVLDPQLFQERPGFTSVIEHKIFLKEDTPVRQKSYRIPERLLPALKREPDILKEMGVVEQCCPIVLVPKKDRTLRFCIDFRHINAISNFDPYPMPRIDDLLERVGRSQFISTLDLCKGYWQVPLA